MKEFFKDYLFQHHILVYDLKYDINVDIHFNALITLANKFGIRIKNGASMANVQMIHDAERNLGMRVPEPFYRGFPATVRELTPSQLLYDQLYHYTQTYGLGWFDQAGHSVLENDIPRPDLDKVYATMIPEHMEPKDFTILNEVDAKQELFYLLDGLCKSTRPFSIDQKIIVYEAYKEYGTGFMSEGLASKRNAVFFYYKTKDVAFLCGLRLADVIKLLDYIQYNEYGSEKLNKLNLKNQDRKIITRMIDYFFEENDIFKVGSIAECFEKQKVWQGLLHHIHYIPKTPHAEKFVKDIREGENYSPMARFENLMNKGEYGKAAFYLKDIKGQSALVRKLNYILSRCKTEKEIGEVLSCLE